MKRNVVSGAQKRKRSAEEKEKMSSKLPKLTSWYNAGAMSASNTAPSNIASTSTSTPASNHPAPADISMVSLPVCACLAHSTRGNTQICNSKGVSIQDTDPGLQNITNNSTENYWIRSGSSSCQNHDSNL